MGMKPDEIKRLLDASANTTAPPVSAATYAAVPPPAVPAPNPHANKKAAAHQKVAARAADLHSFAAQLQSNSAASRVQAIEEVSLDLPDFRASTLQERERAETMLREVYALRKREKYAEAIARCRDALNLVPSDAAALEMFGDLLQGVARTNEAMAAYKRATEADSKRVSAERKYGDLLMRQGKWQEPDTEEVSRNPIAAAAFSLLIPGAGQIHNGEKLKGAVLLVCAAVAMAALLFLMRNKAPWATSADVKPAAGSARAKHVAIDWTAEAPVIGCVLFYTVLGIGSAFDAAVVAARNRRPN
jgi:tetratricopeptide (TPR) repeat protein